MPRTRIVSVVLLSLVLMLMGNSAAYAMPDDCNDKVIDTTAARVLDIPAVESAISRLETVGADVRVRAFEAAPLENLDAYQASQVANCASWRSPNGVTKDNLVTVLFSMDRQSALFYGANWHGGLDSNVDRIRADYMNAQFRLGNFTQGIVGSLDETRAVLNEQLHPGSRPSPQIQPIASPVNWSLVGAVTLWTVGSIVGLVLVALLIGLAVRAHGRRQETARIRQDAKRRAIAAKQTADTAYVSLSSVDDVEPLILITVAGLNDSDTTELQDSWSQTEGAIEDADAAMHELIEDPISSDPAQPRTAAEYNTITSRYQTAYNLVVLAASQVAAVKQRCEELQQKIAQAPTALATSEKALAELTKLNNALVDAGYKTSAAGQLKRVSELIAQVRQLLADKQPGQALDELVLITSVCHETRTSLLTIRSVRTELTTRHASLVVGRQACSAQLAKADALVATLKAGFHRSCWVELATESKRLTDDLRAIDRVLTAVQANISMAHQNWDQATTQLNEADGRLRRVQASLAKLISDAERATKLPVTVAGNLKSLADDIAAVRSDIGDMKGEHSEQLTLLGQQEQQLAPLRSALTVTMPDYVDIAGCALELRTAVAETLSSSRRIHDAIVAEEAAEQRRKQRAIDDEAARQRRRRDEEDAARRRRNSSGSSGSSTYGGSYDSGGGSSGSWGGDSGGGSSGSW